MNISLTQFRWSQMTYSILESVGIHYLSDLEGISIKALANMGIPDKTIKHIENLCKVHNIETKEISSLKAYWFRYNFRDIHDKDNIFGYPRMALYAAYDEEHAKELFLNEYNGKNYELVGDYSIEETRINIGDRII